MSIKVITTKDGSKSLFLPEMNETYHSKFGAQTESEHVYIKSGYSYINQYKKDSEPLDILEIGFGTGLNLVLTYLSYLKNKRPVYYETIEKFPLNQSLIDQLNFYDTIPAQDFFIKIHQAPWQKPIELDQHFTLKKNKIDLKVFRPEMTYDLVYFDAFAPDKQPELWTVDIFKKLFDAMKAQAVLVTYSAKGQVRRNMIAAGFTVERSPGPPGKREMLRAIKKS